MEIKKDSITENIPNFNLLIIFGHRVVTNYKILRARDVPNAKRIKTEPTIVYTICTEKKSILSINRLKVLGWSTQEWTEYSKKNNINWMDNKKVVSISTHM